MNKKEYLLRKKEKRRSITIKRLEVEITRLAEVLYSLPEDNQEEKDRILNQIRNHKARVEKANRERQEIIQKIVNIP